FRSLLSVVPWNPPAARASSAFWAVSLSLAVMVTVPPFWSHFPVTPSTFLRISSTALTHWGQHRCVFFSSTLVSAPNAPDGTRTSAHAARTCNVFIDFPSVWRWPAVFGPGPRHSTAHGRGGQSPADPVQSRGTDVPGP